MVRLILSAGVALAFLASPASAESDFTTGVTAMVLANDICPQAPFSKEDLNSMIAVSAEIDGVSIDEQVIRIAISAIAAEQRIRAKGAVDKFCRNVASRAKTTSN